MSLRTNCGVSHVVKRVSWLVVCRCGSRRRWSAAKVKVMRIRADGPGAVKDGCWAWTDPSWLTVNALPAGWWLTIDSIPLEVKILFSRSAVRLIRYTFSLGNLVQYTWGRGSAEQLKSSMVNCCCCYWNLHIRSSISTCSDNWLVVGTYSYKYMAYVSRLYMFILIN